MLAAVILTTNDPLMPAGMKTLSTLLRVSAVPPMADDAPLNTLPRKVCPPAVTSKFKLLTKALPEVGPGASVQASVTRNGLEESGIVPAKTLVCPEAVKRSAWN